MKPILRLDGVCKNFGGVVAAKDVTFSVYPGEICGLIGPNGAGKSTIMNLISGITPIDKGNIYFDEKDITNTPDYQRARMGIGRTFQTPRFVYRSSIKDNLLLGIDLGEQIGYFKGFWKRENEGDLKRQVNKLLEFVNFDLNWDDKITSLPFGQRKLLEIVRSMLSRPRVILVDEPAAGLNNKEIEHTLDLLNYAAKECGIGILLIEHSMDMIMNICKDIVVLNFGEVIATGEPKEIASNNLVIEAYLGREEI